MFVETLKASVVVKALITVLSGVVVALFVKKVVEDNAPGDNFPHAVMYR